MKNKILTKTEMKILVYNKVKRDGISYDEAKNQLSKEIETMLKNQKKKEEKKDFKEEFNKLKNGK